MVLDASEPISCDAILIRINEKDVLCSALALPVPEVLKSPALFSLASSVPAELAGRLKKGLRSGL